MAEPNFASLLSADEPTAAEQAAAWAKALRQKQALAGTLSLAGGDLAPAGALQERAADQGQAQLMHAMGQRQAKAQQLSQFQQEQLRHLQEFALRREDQALEREAQHNQFRATLGQRQTEFDIKQQELAAKAAAAAAAAAAKNQEKEDARTFELLGDEYHIKPGINERQANVIHNKVGAYKKVFTGLDQTEKYLHQIVDPQSPSDIAEGLAGLKSTSTDVSNNITQAYAGSRSARALEDTREQLGANVFSRDAAEAALKSVGGDKAEARKVITRRLRAARELIQQNAREDLMDMTTKGSGVGASAKGTVKVVFNPATGLLEPVK